MKIITKAKKDAGGILKWGPMEASRVVPCFMKRVWV